MKVISSLGCVVTVYLLASTVQAQLSCEVNVEANELLGLLGASPSDACRTQMLAIVQVQDYVAEAATVFQALGVICEPVCLEYVHMVAQRCVPSYVDTLGLACGKNEQDIFCYQNVLRNNGTVLLAQCFPSQPTLPPATGTTDAGSAAAENTTTDSFTDPTTEAADPPTQPMVPFMCSNVCRGALQDFRATHGCCVSNAFNTSAFGLLQFGIASYGLWRACGVEIVSGNCSSPFVDDQAPMPTDTGYVLAAHGVLSLLSVLLAFLLIV